MCMGGILEAKHGLKLISHGHGMKVFFCVYVGFFVWGGGVLLEAWVKIIIHDRSFIYGVCTKQKFTNT